MKDKICTIVITFAVTSLLFLSGIWIYGDIQRNRKMERIQNTTEAFVSMGKQIDSLQRRLDSTYELFGKRVGDTITYGPIQFTVWKIQGSCLTDTPYRLYAKSSSLSDYDKMKEAFEASPECAYSGHGLCSVTYTNIQTKIIYTLRYDARRNGGTFLELTTEELLKLEDGECRQRLKDESKDILDNWEL